MTSTGNNAVVWANLPPIPDNTTLIYNNGTAVVANSADATVSVPYGESYNIPNFSGMLLVNDHNNGGVAMYLAGSGASVLVSNTTPGFDATLTMNGGGYDWTNTNNLNGPFTFTVIKTRNGS